MSAVACKNVDDRTKRLIFGYMREARQLFPHDITYYNIPISINYICLLFYWMKDKWNADRLSDEYEINENALKRTEQSGSTTALLTNAIVTGRTRWKFQISSFKELFYANSFIIIGIVKDNVAFDKLLKTHLGNCAQSAYVLDVLNTELNVHEKPNNWNKGYGVKAK